MALTYYQTNFMRLKMKKFERKIRERAKNEVANFELWYKQNELKIVNMRLYTRQTKPNVESKKKFDWGKWLLNGVVYASMVFLILAVIYMPKTIIEQPEEDIHVQQPPEVVDPEDQQKLFYEKIVAEYYKLVVESMGVNITFEDISTFAVEVVDDKYVLTSVKGEVKTPVDNYVVNFHFPLDENHEFSGKQDYENLTTEYRDLNNYTINYSSNLISENTYNYKMQIIYQEVNVCYLDMYCSQNDFEDFVNTVFTQPIVDPGFGYFNLFE